jgi:hypothetical protein
MQPSLRVQKWRELMERAQPERLDDQEVRADLKAALEARRELGPEMEEHVVEAFLARIDQRVQAQVAQQVAVSQPSRPVRTHHENRKAPWVLPASLGLAIPLCAIAGDAAQGVGIIGVLALILIINVVYYSADP